MSASIPVAQPATPGVPAGLVPVQPSDDLRLRPNATSREVAEAMYERYHAELYRAAMRACRDPETAEDLVHEAFVRLIVEIDARRTPDNVRAWLHRVVANLAISLGRRVTVRRRFAGALVSADEPGAPEAAAVDVELRADLADALRSLPDGAGKALVLAANGFSGEEIAVAIGRSHLATRALMFRARSALRDRLLARDVMDVHGHSIPVPAARPARRAVAAAPTAA